MSDKTKKIVLYVIIIGIPIILHVISIYYMSFRVDTWKTHASNNQLPQEYKWVDALAFPMMLMAMIGSITTQIICGLSLQKLNARSFPLFIVLSIACGFILAFINFASYVALY